jgi:hypothetical protein
MDPVHRQEVCPRSSERDSFNSLAISRDLLHGSRVQADSMGYSLTAGTTVLGHSQSAVGVPLPV